MNDYTNRKDGSGKFDFLTEFIDTLEVGKTILPVSEREKIQTVYYRKDPKTERGSFWLRKRLVWMRSSHETVCNSS